VLAREIQPPKGALGHKHLHLVASELFVELNMVWLTAYLRVMQLSPDYSSCYFWPLGRMTSSYCRNFEICFRTAAMFTLDLFYISYNLLALPTYSEKHSFSPSS
jgi:hypothetical protein